MVTPSVSLDSSGFRSFLGLVKFAFSNEGLQQATATARKIALVSSNFVIQWNASPCEN